MVKTEPLNSASFGFSSHHYQELSATVPEGVGKEQLQDPKFWSNVRSKIRAHDQIRVVAEDSSYYALVLVTAVSGSLIYTKVLFDVTLDQADLLEATEGQSRYVVKLCGPKKWCVIDTTSDTKIKEGITQRSLAERELEEYLRALAA